MFRNAIAALAFAALSAPALAEPSQTCPDNAEQILTNVLQSIGTAHQPSAEDVYNTAKTASDICIDRADAQALAADLLSLIARGADDPANQRFFWGLAHLAVRRSDQAYDKNAPDVVVTMADGSSHTFYTFQSTTVLLKTQIMPNLLAGIRNGEVHEIFTTEKLAACPYSMQADGQARARSEADAIVDWGYYQSKEAIPFGATRITALKQACEEQTPYLTYALGTYYAKAANYRSLNDDYPSLEWAKKAEALLTEFIAMNMKRSDDRTTIGMAKSQLEKARKVLGKVTPD